MSEKSGILFLYLLEDLKEQYGSFSCPFVVPRHLAEGKITSKLSFKNVVPNCPLDYNHFRSKPLHLQLLIIFFTSLDPEANQKEGSIYHLYNNFFKCEKNISPLLLKVSLIRLAFFIYLFLMCAIKTTGLVCIDAILST